jgi:radical SAM superfamily enzyme YgiQ (UPF0313 family)
MDTFSLALAQSFPGRRRPALTFAPEAGTERLRQVINKRISDKQLQDTLATAAARGWSSVKLYFMVGLPTETQEDVEAIGAVVRQATRLPTARGGRLQVRVSVNNFIPKPHTPFQWVAQITPGELEPKQEALRRSLRRAGVHLSWQDPRMSLLEGILARGDRRLGRVILRAWEGGSVFDAWSEGFRYEAWQAAFEECGLEPSFYAHRTRSLSEVFPWSHIDVGVSPDFLQREYQRAISGSQEQSAPSSPTG